MFDQLTHNRWVRNRYTRRVAHWVRRVLAMLSAKSTDSNASTYGIASAPTMPVWLQDEMRALASIEPELLPPGSGVERYAFYSVPMDTRQGEVYAALSDAIGGEPYTHALLVPWLKPGGADRGILYHASAIAQSDPLARILVLTTEPASSPWASRLPAQAQCVDFGNIAASLDFNQQVNVMVRVLLQLRAPTVHLVNSRVGWDAILRHGLALTQHSRLFASLFCDDYDQRMNPVGYARDYLRYCYPHLSTVICDNSRYPQIWSRELGIPRGSFTFIPFPYDGRVAESCGQAISADGARRVLWAGRLDRQKRPDILAAIATRMPDVHFDVYGAQVMSGAAVQDFSQLRSLHNVTLHGEFQRLEDVATPDHFAYLHTTAWEGTPTILFDVAAARLPILAPQVGGIVDFLAEEDMVERYDDVDAFVSQLRLLQSSAQLRSERVQRQLESLRRNRRWEDFTASLEALDGYLTARKRNASAGTEREINAVHVARG
ncbi:MULTISPECIES: glycosyltransferase [Stenotrophomonas]|uniref:glycosyltransferase n=1 Tax=Stenotrophomonas TaxID=40323 RepID=UPI0012FE5E75|nr:MULTISPECIES: glycosyltransferase [Stenotrophomonas]MDQ7302795.1 glycosyltransferase [Stenotrophomonas sp. Sm0581]HEQ1703802.1 glycosyltransferase [Stenotrophomonas maltophilia]